MSLPEPWVNKLFDKLAVTYGQSFLRQYDGIPLADVKANWAEELSCFQQSPEAIRYGLEYLPADRAPTVLQFRDLCRRAPEKRVAALEAPKEPANPEVVAKAREILRKPGNGYRAWARTLKAKEEAGASLTLFQRSAWREALSSECAEAT